jgi:hypothetical protein
MGVSHQYPAEAIILKGTKGRIRFEEMEEL